jgi:hypothetical protein
MVLEAARNGAGMSAGIDLEGMGDAVRVQDVMQLACVDPQTVLVSHIHGDGPVLPQITDVLVDESQGSVCSSLGDYILPDRPVLSWQIEVKRRLLRIGRPGGGRGELSTQSER